MRIINLKKQPKEGNKFQLFSTNGIEFMFNSITREKIDDVKKFNDYRKFIYSLINYVEYLNENDEEFLDTKFKNYSNRVLKELYKK